MKILIVNLPHLSIGSRIPQEQLPPLGLLCVGGSLINAGHDVTLLDAELGNMPHDEIIRRVTLFNAEVLLIGHSGSTSAHPIAMELTRRFRAENSQLTIVYGGVFPTYHFHDILTQEPQIDVVVRGEGEATLPRLIAAIEHNTDLAQVNGIAFRQRDSVVETPPAQMIENLDDYRVGWELVDLKRYSYYGGKQAVVMQFSRGCPHLCNYCGQRGFWARWRHRNPQKFANRPKTLGLQTSGFKDSKYASMENFSLGKIDRVDATGKAKSTLAVLSSTRPSISPRHELVHPYGKTSSVA